MVKVEAGSVPAQTVAATTMVVAAWMAVTLAEVPSVEVTLEGAAAQEEEAAATAELPGPL